LGEKGHKDAYGNYVPSRYEVDPGTKGSIEYAQKMRDEYDGVSRMVDDIPEDEKYDMEKAIGKPYSQQPGRTAGKGPGHIVHPGREDEGVPAPQDLDEEMRQAIERDRPSVTLFPETGGVLDTSKVADVEMEDIDPHDYPDFSDAFISDASYQMADGTYRQMTDKELEILNEDGDFVYNSIPDDVMSGGE
jgi:hypothetical protein